MVEPNRRPSKDEPAWWFIVSAGEIWLTEQQHVPFGELQQMSFPDLADDVVMFIGELRERHCYLIIADYKDSRFEGGEFVPLRELLSHGDDELFAMAGSASQIAHFIQTHRFCGQCGSRMDWVDWELAAHCPRCQHRCYPRISPCVIVAIEKHGQILLAQGKRHKTGRYSILAGFVETGESLEQAAHREVMEEAGIEITDLRYRFSQPWPFPHSLMMGYTARWKSGELHIDPHELVTGDWFAFDELPEIPPPGTIARELIDTLINDRSAADE
ncbi:NAD(+) diphosphatase [Idiomarina tyrosinivorans]|uniref:NAD-capped RNA hydrolase NudC n=1 Tax=Idiomarina tyrosinivorans TaxID=1445662 RepID=A0A432ZH20_9GAMM|nr:NAD(+) diphosphatase [Idiomarina tyrosinivorans]RUO76592.1 NAD(+) diphosphatase [Idiomarina tyrosinivorans]